MALIDIVFSSFLGNKKHLFKEEERAGVFRPQHMKGALQNQLSIGGQVRTLPVDQQRLNLLFERTNKHSAIFSYYKSSLLAQNTGVSSCL